MEAKRHPESLKQYRKVSGKWQFAPVARDAKGAPDPRLVVIDGEPTSSKGGTFYLEFKHHGKLRQESIGTVPREALEAGPTKCAVLTGLIEPEDEPEEVVSGLTIEQAIEKDLVEVEATATNEIGRTFTVTPGDGDLFLIVNYVMELAEAPQSVACALSEIHRPPRRVIRIGQMTYRLGAGTNDQNE